MKYSKVSYQQILISFFFMLNISAFTVTDDFKRGAYWHNFPIQMAKFASFNIEDPLLSGLVQQAAVAWESVVGKELWEIPEEFYFNEVTNSIRWSYNFSQETGFDDQSTLAITIRYSLASSFEKVEIILNGNNPFLRDNSQNMLYQTILHELGHVVGLGHSEYVNAVMAANLSGVDSLHEDDIQGMNYLADETLSRQSGRVGSNELNAFENDSNSGVASCGSVDMSSGGGGGPGSFFLTLLLGFLAMVFVQHPKAKISIKY